VQKAAVPAARPLSDPASLEQRDDQLRLALAQGERSPEPRIAAAHDRNIGDEPSGQRGRHLVAGVCAGLLEPPGGRAAERGDEAAASHRSTVTR
jgi:hypothetical protein